MKPQKYLVFTYFDSRLHLVRKQDFSTLQLCFLFFQALQGLPEMGKSLA